MPFKIAPTPQSPSLKALAGSAALIALFTAPAMAQDPPISVVEIDQVQLDDTISELVVEIPDRVRAASATTTATGNTAAGLVKNGDIDVDIVQSQDGVVSAIGKILDGSAREAVATTTAYGNAATGGTWDGDTYYRADQVANGNIEAATVVDMDRARVVVGATTAIANVSSPANENGKNAAFQTQESNGSVTAFSEAGLDRVRKAASFATVAGGNAVSSTGSTSTNINGAVQTTAAGETISARTFVDIVEAKDVIATTTGFGNSATVHNEWGYATLGREGSELFQGNDASVGSETYVTLDSWSGVATSSAYGVGNAATISNVGSDTGLFAIQNNYGDVTSIASLNGGAGSGTGVLTSTAIGNAATATLCNICGDAALQGRTQQYNQGSVIAEGSVTMGASGIIVGSATAVGNSATYQSTGD